MNVIIDNVDFALLKQQKASLLSINENVVSHDQYVAIGGIVNLIDAIQDYAVERLGLDENVVFDLHKD